MKSNIQTIRKSLNKAYLKVKPYRPEFEAFKKNLLRFIDQIDEPESEEFHKNVLSEFLKSTYYSPDHNINTKGRFDLVIHTGKNTESPVGVLIETKRPGDKTEMPTEDNLNTKAFHELLLYWLRERITGNNLEIKYLIATDMYDWFIFNAGEFEKLFAGNKQLVKQFMDFEEGRLSGKTTDFFYRSIAEPFIEQCDQDISVTHIDIRDYEKILREGAGGEENKLIALYKIFSPEHLLKLPFTNDSNTLDKRFYNELLHIIGLKETKEGSKKLIGRKPEGERNAGSLVENAVNILQFDDCLSQVKASDYGTGKEEQLYHISLELVITWINRILFLKLLEGQLVRYNRGDEHFRFLNAGRIPDYDTLNKLFFQVLAVKEEERRDPVRQSFRDIPYLNSSLFEPGELEHKTIRISNLDDEPDIPLLTTTVLKDSTGKRITGRMNTLHYLFAFLDTYDFSGEGSEEIQEESKTLINASVLGLIFEKINGYKDGSFFTPGFITMYMCRETIRRAVVQKFIDAKGWSCETIPDVFNKIDDEQEANRIINSLKICDPAVGSGHFLVSALNEIIAIKSELKILLDREGRRLKYYHVEVANDELVITDEDGELFEYNPASRESQRVQEALFHEKQALIENCLFGVDINPNSVKICRLRLWIELLKSAYYKTPENDSQGLTSSQTLTYQPRKLETLPNIDINIKCGNSLISRYPLDADIKKALRNSRWSIDSYRIAVMTYRNAGDKEVKREMEEQIERIKSDFESEVAANDKRLIRLNKLKGELTALTGQTSMFEKTKAEKLQWEKEVKKLAGSIEKIEKELEDIRNNKIYENAFEWRFEFPEVLNDDGDFTGFDVVIGNPPYHSISLMSENKIFENNYLAFNKNADIYCLFYELGVSLLKKYAYLSLISSNKWLSAFYGKNLRLFLKEHTNPLILIDFPKANIFENATVFTNILLVQNSTFKNILIALKIEDHVYYLEDINEKLSKDHFLVNIDSPTNWILSTSRINQINKKIEEKGKLLKELNLKFFRGVTTGLNEVFIITPDIKDDIIAKDSKSEEIIKPLLRGKDIKRYRYTFNNEYLIFTRRGIDIEKFPSIKNYLIKWNNYLKPKKNVKDEIGRKPGNYEWFEIQDNTAYFKEFYRKKIIWLEISEKANFSYDENGMFLTNSAYFIAGEDLKYLLAILNSRVSDFYLFQITAHIAGGRKRYTKQYVEKIPIPEAESNKKEKIIEIVDKILTSKKQDPTTDTTYLEAEIDRMIYELYSLTDEEIRIVEEAVG